LKRKSTLLFRTRSGASRTYITIAFIVIAIFLLVQVAWWGIFQSRYIDKVSRDQFTSWQRDAEITSLLLASSDDLNLKLHLLEQYPHLRFNESDYRFKINEVSLKSFQNAQRGYIRMFSFEGPVFALVVLSLLFFIARSMWAERELKQRQHNFLSAITHEFKTPLSSLRLLVQTARLRDLSVKKLDEYLGNMEEELDRLDRTSEQVLASARLEQAKEPPILEAADLNQVLEALINEARRGIEARGANLTFLASAEALPVSIDQAAFGVVINNLLDNAVKYSPGQEKQVLVSLESTKNVIYLHVDDQGIGFEESGASRLFERFYRAGEEMTRSTPGVGLGLYLVRSITEAMNGWVRAVPNPVGRGARFTVVLPRRLSSGRSDENVSTVEEAI
jgi:two-component system sensor histidine kinase SenX3